MEIQNVKDIGNSVQLLKTFKFNSILNNQFYAKINYGGWQETRVNHMDRVKYWCNKLEKKTICNNSSSWVKKIGNDRVELTFFFFFKFDLSDVSINAMAGNLSGNWWDIFNIR